MKNEKTSKFVASEASDVLRDKRASKEERSVAGSALTQAPDHKKGASATATKATAMTKKSGGCR